MGCIDLVRCVLVLRCGLAVVVWYPYAGFSYMMSCTNIVIQSKCTHQIISQYDCLCCGAGSSVGIATEIRTGQSGIESRWDEIFCPSRPALGPTQSPVQWVPGLSRA